MLIAIEKIWVNVLNCTEEITFIKHNLVSENTSYGELLLLLGLSQKPFFVYLGLFNEFTWKSPQRVVPSGRGTVNRATSVVLLFLFFCFSLCLCILFGFDKWETGTSDLGFYFLDIGQTVKLQFWVLLYSLFLF